VVAPGNIPSHHELTVSISWYLDINSGEQYVTQRGQRCEANLKRFLILSHTPLVLCAAFPQPTRDELLVLALDFRFIGNLPFFVEFT
jgi:hypothetical protein